MHPDLTVVARNRYVSFTTFRRTGEPVSTPVWIARDGDELVFISDDNVGKVKRLKRDQRCELTPCSMRGEIAPDAPTYAGTATVHRDEETIRRGRAAIGRKYAEYRAANLLIPVLRRLGVLKKPSVAIRITLG